MAAPNFETESKPSTWPIASEGKIPFVINNETYETWYRICGDLQQTDVTPLVILHGGPGLSHDYLLPISDISSTRPVMFYDQLGNSRSTHIHDKPISFWTVDLFLDELDNLLNHFGIQDKFDLLGHSWGGIMALEYELRRQPAGLKRIILTDSLSSKPLWDESNAQLQKTFPPEIQEALKIGLKDLDISGPAMKIFRKKYGCRIDPFPYEYEYTLDQIFTKGADTTVIKAFTQGEVLKDWTSIDRLHLVRQPTLVINGRYDPSQDFVNVPFFRNLRRVKWVTLEKSAHVPMWDERERYMILLKEFLDV